MLKYYVDRVAQSVQRLATGWTVRGLNPGVGEIFRTCPDRPWGPPSLVYDGYWVFPGGKEQPRRDADPSPPTSAVFKTEQSYNSTPCAASTEPQCLYKAALYLYLYLYSPYGPYGLYRASVPVQRYTLSLPIPLLPLWTVRSVQSLSTCTTVHFIFTYSSTPPMDRTACTEPQCLYNGALYLLPLYDISGFPREVGENCALLGYYAACSGKFLPKVRNNLLVPS